MLQDLLGSLTSPDAYRRFAREKASRTMLYLAFLSMIFTGAGTVGLKLRVAPLIDETFAWLENDIPTLTFNKGTVASALTEPKRIAHPRFPEVALMIDTAQTEPVTAQMFAEQKVLAYLTSNAMYLERNPGQIDRHDLAKAAPDAPVTIDAKFFREAASAMKTVLYPLTLISLFAMFAAWTAICAVFYAFLGMLFNSVAGGPLGFGALYQDAIHAQTASTLLRAVLAIAPFAFPFAGLLSLAATAIYLWLAIGADARAASAGGVAAAE